MTKTKMSNAVRPTVAASAVLLLAWAAPAAAADWPAGYTKCADEGGTCAVGTAKRKVSYGARDTWTIKELSGNVACNNATFGDPLRGTKKFCAIGPVVTEPAPTPTCEPLDKRIRSTRVPVGGNVSPSDEYTPTVIVPRADGTSLLAWTDGSAQNIRLATLKSTDTLDRSLSSLEGLEVHAATAINGGTALAVMANDPSIYSSKYCRGSATPGNAVCGKMDLVRIDDTGKTLSRTTLTKKQNVDSDGAQFIWWYGHSSRIATDGSKLAVYYRSAMSTPRPGAAGEVDIHAGDTLKFVDAANGSLLSGGWDWGCSHSWSVRTAYNGKQWAAACHGDAFPNAMQVSRLDSPTTAPNALQWLGGTDPARRALGGMVPASDGFWVNYIAPTSGSGLALNLAKVGTTGSALTQQRVISQATSLDSDYPFRPYMAAYGTGKLLMGWKSSGRLALAVANASTGAVVEGPVLTSLPIDRFQDIVNTPKGDVVWAHSAGGTTIDVTRVAACRLSN
jgi:hypothetical protein